MKVEALRQRIDELLHSTIEHGIGLAEDVVQKRRGDELWHQCQALTAGLAGELAEQLRLILEPTLTSRLAGDYRTGWLDVDMGQCSCLFALLIFQLEYTKKAGSQAVLLQGCLT